MKQGYRVGVETVKAGKFQEKVRAWLIACFGPSYAAPDQMRAARFVEESLELGHASGLTFEEVVELARREYSKPAGEVQHELGDAYVTLAALAEVEGHSLKTCGKDALIRNWDRVDLIRAKQAEKPLKTVLPGAAEPVNNWEPTERQINSACMSYTHDFGLLDEERQRKYRFQAREWLRAWLWELPRTPALRKVKAPDPVRPVKSVEDASV